MATVHLVTRNFIVAHCVKGFLYYLPWTGKETGYRDLVPGTVVRVYHTGGFSPEVHTFEAIHDQPASS